MFGDSASLKFCDDAMMFGPAWQWCALLVREVLQRCVEGEGKGKGGGVYQFYILRDSHQLRSSTQ